MTCQGCQYAPGGTAGPQCPARIHGWVRPGFDRGCNLNPASLANANLKAPTSRQEPEPCPTPAQEVERQPAAKPAKIKGPNKTEAEYYRKSIKPMLDDGKYKAAMYEGVTFKLANGHRYTPDWFCVYASGRPVLIEVKGSYKFGSHGRARLAFDQAKTEWPMFDWFWATKTKEGWQVE